MIEAITYVIVGHHSRRHPAEKLAKSLKAHLIIDEYQHGANWNHRRALEWANKQVCRVVIIEDDAVLVEGFKDKVAGWLARFPDDLCSFYLGTGRPPQYQLDIAMKLIESDKRQTDYITMKRLIHGVCYSPPPASIPRILARWDVTKPADFAVGDAYGGVVIYPCWSLVDHADGDSVERHPDAALRTERRRAWRFYG
ncbi:MULTISPECIES: hypothetical protein [Pantoea]|uniref:Glycosyltransferase n=1 Tax=Candidatus Pantoea gossypiicola TaxID=2608008 RepID=A0AB34CP92_9GAMM|nr:MULTISPECIES: hypothetical protein [Pantoea]KAA5961020.1 hypothetical protein F3I55_00945 [Pantoea sp. VH_24]KAA5964439.1 hypothetical protein F3I53_01085 [Pantoea sp. VH_16]KAA5968623.1 hypothetical protein F3I54_01430 [Pantoea sp. VH_18]KAA6004310.1 hypothetical protein F3I46_00400 [Pantoea sp. M_1]KAA6006794.1 hypothetical protein F3I45_01060 [Pantoea sp. F_7]